MSHSPAVSREGDESELENTKQGDNPAATAREMTVDKEGGDREGSGKGV